MAVRRNFIIEWDAPPLEHRWNFSFLQTPWPSKSTTLPESWLHPLSNNQNGQTCNAMSSTPQLTPYIWCAAHPFCSRLRRFDQKGIHVTCAASKFTHQGPHPPHLPPLVGDIAPMATSTYPLISSSLTLITYSLP